MGASPRHDLSTSPLQRMEANAVRNQALVYFIVHHESVKWLHYLFIYLFCELAWGPHGSGRCWAQGIWEKQAAADMKGARPTSYSIRMKGAHLKSGCLKNATRMFFRLRRLAARWGERTFGRPRSRQNRKVWEGAVALFCYAGGARHHGARQSCHTDRCTCRTSPEVTGYSVFIDANKCGLFST